MFTGSLVALITPFKNEAVDEDAFLSLVEWQVNQGTHGLVPCGTTGESPTLDHHEHRRVIDMCVEAADRRIPVIAGTGSNSTDEAVALTRYARQAGAAAALVVTPYYNKPTQEGLYQHFKAIHDSAELPIIIYNIPGRSGVDLSVATMARLARLPNIVGVKDATANLARPLDTRIALGPDFCQLSGEDTTVVAFLAQGGVGCISVTANVVPAQCAALHEAWRIADAPTVFRLRDQLQPLSNSLFLETNPAPVKYAVSLLGRCEDSLRLPLVPVTEATRQQVQAAMTGLGLIG